MRGIVSLAYGMREDEKRLHGPGGLSYCSN